MLTDGCFPGDTNNAITFTDLIDERLFGRGSASTVDFRS
jgi:hypothetical protein